MSIRQLRTLPLHLVGLNHTSASIEMRERLYFNEEGCRKLLAQALMRREVSELVVLSTCNRTELYGLSKVGSCALTRLLAEESGIPLESLAPHLYTKSSVGTIRHLFGVAAGIDSMVVGEQQIQAQVKQAYRLATAMKTTGPVLNKLFHQCFRSGKRSRAETGISEGRVSLASCAVSLLQQERKDLASLAVLVVGAGATGRIVIEALRAAGATHITIVNRTGSRAAELARKYLCAASPLERLPEELRACEAVICAAGAPAPLISREMLAQATEGRSRPLCCIDIAMPRNIAPDAANCAAAEIHDLATLQHSISQTLEQRRSEMPAVAAIIDQELDLFAQWHRRYAASPSIRRLREHFEQIRQQELARYRKYFDEKEWDKVDRFSRSLFNKVLHQPFTQLNQCGGRHETCERCTLQEIFGLDA